MTTPQTFPRELLKASNEEKLNYFKHTFVDHPMVNEAKSQIKLILNHPGDTFVIFVYGPAGAGKSTLMRLLINEVNQELHSCLEANRGMIAAAGMEVALEQSGVFNPKGHLKRSLIALEDPAELLDCKIKYNVKGIGRNKNDNDALVIDPHIVEPELGLALENALLYRRLKLFCLDEAHHMLAYSSGKRIATMPETIKSIANRSKTVHGLFGTYDLLILHDVGDQLSRRSAYIHLPRYHADSTWEWQIFQSLVHSFLLEMPLEQVPDLLPHCPFLYERSLGCAGILKNWFNNALADVYREGAKTLTLKHLEKRALSVAQCLNILKKIKEGEDKHREIEGQVEQLRQELGLEICSVLTSPQSENVQPQPNSDPVQEQPVQASTRKRGRPKKDSAQEQSVQASTRKRGRPKAVGMPNPERYPVGVQEGTNCAS